jgi:hypothetical protein
VGIVGALASDIFPPPVGSIVKFGLIVSLFLVMILVSALRRLDYVSSQTKTPLYYITIPSTPADLDGAIEIAQYYFGEDALNPSVVRDAYKVNPFGFIVIRDHHQKVVGYLDYYGLSKTAFEQFKSGTVNEASFEARSFIDARQINLDKQLYIGGLAIKADSKFEIGKITQYLISAGFDLLLRRHLVDNADFSLYATGYSKEGCSVLTDVGFGQVRAGKYNSSNMPLYWRTVNRRIVSRYRRDHAISRNELLITFEKDVRI